MRLFGIVIHCSIVEPFVTYHTYCISFTYADERRNHDEAGESALGINREITNDRLGGYLVINPFSTVCRVIESMTRSILGEIQPEKTTSSGEYTS